MKGGYARTYERKGVKSQRTGGFGELLCELVFTRLEHHEAFYYPVGKADFGIDGILQLSWGTPSLGYMIGVQSKGQRDKPITFSVSLDKVPWLLRFPGPLLLIATRYASRDRTPPTVAFYDYRELLTRRLEELKQPAKHSNSLEINLGDLATSVPLDSMRWHQLYKIDKIRNVLDKLINKNWRAMATAEDPMRLMDHLLRTNRESEARAYARLAQQNALTKDPSAGKVIQSRYVRWSGDRPAALSILTTLSKRLAPGCKDEGHCCSHYELAVAQHENALVTTSKRAYVQVMTALRSIHSAGKSHIGKDYLSTRARLAMAGLGFACDMLFIRELAGLRVRPPSKSILKDLNEWAISSPPHLLDETLYEFQCKVYRSSLAEALLIDGSAKWPKAREAPTTSHIALLALHLAFWAWKHDRLDEARSRAFLSRGILGALERPRVALARRLYAVLHGTVSE